MKAVIFSIFLVSFPLAITAQTHSDFVCPNHIAARQCNQHCKPTGGKSAFMVDRSTQSIMIKRYDKNKAVQHSRIVKKCTIFSNENWRCEDMTQTGYRQFVLQVDSMVDGLYSHELTDEKTTSEVSNEIPRAIFNFCSKPSR
jgi:hypothetical protein